MNARDIISLEFLHRDTDPTLPVEERESLQEILAFAFSEEREFPGWVFDAFFGVTREIPEHLTLWLCDLANSSSMRTVDDDMISRLEKLWSHTQGVFAKARTFEVVLDLDNLRAQTDSFSDAAPARLLRQATRQALESEDSASLLGLIDLVLVSARPNLLRVVVEELRERGAAEARNYILSHIRARIPLMSSTAREAVEQL